MQIAPMNVALAIMSILTAIVGPTRSSRTPATGLTSKPGTIAANVSQPANAGEENRASKNSTNVRMNIRPARRDKVAAQIRGIKPGILMSLCMNFAAPWESPS